MPARLSAHARATASRPVSLLVLAAALAGCASTEQAAAPAAPAPGGPVVDAASLAALADDRPATDLPPANDSALTLAELGRTQPRPGSVGGYPAAQTEAALALAARLVAATRADPSHLCGPRASSPASGSATAGLRAWLADPANATGRTEIETTIGASAGADDCGPLVWVGPGVAVGPQQWALSPDVGGGLLVRWSGSFGYALVDGQGRPEPWGMRGQVAYRLVLDGGEWRLSGWHDGATGRVAQGWPHDVPMPRDYLAAPAAPASDRDALKAILGAARAWRATPASEVTVEQTVEGQDGSGSVVATAHAAPARGDAAGEVAGSQTLWLDRGQRVLSKALTGSAPGWAQRDATAPTDFGISAPVSPFAVAALLGDADAAAPADCPPGLGTEQCFTAAVATADSTEPLSVDADLAHRAGLPWLVLDAGVDADGRPVFVRVAQQAAALGAPYATLTSTARFTAYPDAPPPPPAHPGPAAALAGEDGR